jgi:CRP-like cAMP-binding protein
MQTVRRRRAVAARSPDRIVNRLLAALPREDLDRLRPHLRAVDLPHGLLLLRPNKLIDHVYFPQSGMVSLVLTLEDGSAIEVGLVGREGMVGALAPLGATAMSGEARVQMAGTALRMRAGVLRSEAARNPRLMDLLLRYVQALFAQVSQSVACNGRHPLKARMARWLLMVQDCAESAEVPLSHEFLATMLGVRRAGITVAAAEFKETGLVENRRGRFIIRDRDGLEEAACECYQAVRTQYTRLLPEILQARNARCI